MKSQISLIIRHDKPFYSSPYSARFIADENTPDGTPMQPGQTFRKGWILLNDGSMPWTSDDIQLVNLADGITVVKQPIIPVTAPHDRALITVDYMCANDFGTYESKWILSYRHQTFGPMIWCSIEVGHSTENSEYLLIKIRDQWARHSNPPSMWRTHISYEICFFSFFIKNFDAK